MIAIVDYGLGNVLAFANMYKRLNINVGIARSASELEHATKIILPGVGAFDHAMQLLDRSGMRDMLDQKVRSEKVPVLGVCVGMQIMSNSSEEGHAAGLGWIDGQVRLFNLTKLEHGTRLPHMGWNDVSPVAAGGLFAELESDARFYFLHSYYFHCNSQDDALAVAEYGGVFSCAVRHENIYGVQFHPEKSHRYGARLLKNFAEL